MVDQLEFPPTGSGPRNLSEWISATDVNVSYYKAAKGKEKVRTLVVGNRNLNKQMYSRKS